MEKIPERRLDPPPEPDYIEPRCPICGAACDTFHVNKDHEIVGCEECLYAVDAWDWVNT